MRFVVQAVAFTALFYVFSLYAAALLFHLIFAVTIVFGRLYCGWFCPFGFIMDLEVMLRKALRHTLPTHSDRLNKILHKLKIHISPLSSSLCPLRVVQQPPAKHEFRVAMAKILAGPFRPYTVFIDPMIPQCCPVDHQRRARFSTSTSPTPTSKTSSSGQRQKRRLRLSLAFVGVNACGSFFFRRFWCRFCPTGVSLAVVNRFKGFKWAPLLHIEKDEEKCTKCGVCKRVCQRKLTKSTSRKAEKSTLPCACFATMR